MIIDNLIFSLETSPSVPPKYIKLEGNYELYTPNITKYIKKIMFYPPATIVFWDDGSKTVVKAQNGEPFDKEKGLAMCIVKKMCGNKGNYYNVFKRWCNK